MSRYTEAVERNLEGLHIATGACPGCEGCGLEDVDSMDDERYIVAGEPSFSWYRCDSCGSIKGGSRYPAHGTNKDGDLFHLDVCVDCVHYIEYGTEPEEWEG